MTIKNVANASPEIKRNINDKGTSVLVDHHTVSNMLTQMIAKSIAA
eukprot:CAMPEP_0115303206 /NCGR_PEP_ID=MMETSP0270-20121206/70795_1 /TAXON_ID=71861 /ORGANISM="Scrippsiella trochoidea, Strain CCMP3099" /LENGTH=45 /DNA_ID= /DNA_START= /DNA_END= /DNA_ORIENTATION=